MRLDPAGLPLMPRWVRVAMPSKLGPILALEREQLDPLPITSVEVNIRQAIDVDGRVHYIAHRLGASEDTIRRAARFAGADEELSVALMGAIA